MGGDDGGLEASTTRIDIGLVKEEFDSLVGTSKFGGADVRDSFDDAFDTATADEAMPVEDKVEDFMV